MALSFIDYGTSGPLTATQLAGTFNDVTLDYINTSDLYVIHTDAVTGVKTTLSPSQFTVTVSGSTTNVQILTAANGGIDLDDEDDLIRIGRNTDIQTLTREFTDGSVLKASDLNAANKQLLFALQEDADTGIGSLPTDTDGKFDAQGKVIKNLGQGTNANDSVTKSYVDNMSLYGPVTEPQEWTFELKDGTTSTDGADRTFPLTGSTHDNDIMYIVELDGVIQTTSTYSVTNVADAYTLTMIGAGSQDDDLDLHVRNLGVGRNLLQQPLQAEATSQNSLTIKRIPSQTGNLLHVIDENDNPLSKVDSAGDATFKNVTSEDKLTVTGESNLNGDVKVNGTRVTMDSTTGNTTIAGTLDVGGATSISGTTTFTGGIVGDLNLINGVVTYGAGSGNEGIVSIRQLALTTTRDTDGTTNDQWEIDRTSSGSHTDSNYLMGLSLTLTPASATSKILLIASPRLEHVAGANDINSMLFDVDITKQSGAREDESSQTRIAGSYRVSQCGQVISTAGTSRTYFNGNYLGNQTYVENYDSAVASFGNQNTGLNDSNNHTSTGTSSTTNFGTGGGIPEEFEMTSTYSPSVTVDVDHGFEMELGTKNHHHAVGTTYAGVLKNTPPIQIMCFDTPGSAGSPVTYQLRARNQTDNTKLKIYLGSTYSNFYAIELA